MKPSNDKFEEVVPSNIDAERGVIGCCMYADAGQLAEVRLQISKDDFFLQAYAEIFRVICDLSSAGAKLDATVVYHALQRRGILEEVGGAAEVGNAVASQPGSAALMHYVGIVREMSTRRKLISFADSLRFKATSPANFDNSAEVAQAALGDLTKLVSGGIVELPSSIGEIVGEVREDLNKSPVRLIPSGWWSLNEAIGGGVGAGEMIVVAARPSMGKSLLLRQWAMDCACDGTPVGYITLEESRRKIGRNVLSSFAQIDNKKIRSGRINETEFRGIDSAYEVLRPAPMYVSESARALAQIRAQATVWKHRYGIQMLFIDYLTRIRGVAGKDRYEIATNTSMGVSDLLKDLQLGGIIVAQLNRGLASREDKRPTMTDIRESGQIEQDADGIIFLHREDYYHLDESDYVPTRIAELIISKWRDGERGAIVKLQSNLRHQKFIELAGAGTEGMYE